MKEAILSSEEYQQGYLPWAEALVNGPSAAVIFKNVHSDRQALINSVMLFQPPLDELSADLDLPPVDTINGRDEVRLAASFRAAQLGSVAINSLVYKYFVVLNLESDQWPVRYGDDESRRLDQIVKHEHLRVRSEKLVDRTAAAMTAHLTHRVPVASVPERALDWSIDEGELGLATRQALHAAGISTLGDLGILSLNQLKKIPGVGKVGIDKIKDEFDRLGWLSPPHAR